jgi:hypothetical protein
MSVRAMLSAFRQFSKKSSIHLRQFIIVDHRTQINRMSKRLKQYQSLVQTKLTNNKNIDLNDVDSKSFGSVFGVPTIAQLATSSSESDDDDDDESEQYRLPYTDHAKSIHWHLPFILDDARR